MTVRTQVYYDCLIGLPFIAVSYTNTDTTRQPDRISNRVRSCACYSKDRVCWCKIFSWHSLQKLCVPVKLLPLFYVIFTLGNSELSLKSNKMWKIKWRKRKVENKMLASLQLHYTHTLFFRHLQRFKLYETMVKIWHSRDSMQKSGNRDLRTRVGK